MAYIPPDQLPSAPQKPGAPQKATKAHASTMAYIPPDQLPSAPQKPGTPQKATKTTKAKKAHASTMAYIPPDQLPRTSEVVVGAPAAQPKPAPEAAAKQETTAPTSDAPPQARAAGQAKSSTSASSQASEPSQEGAPSTATRKAPEVGADAPKGSTEGVRWELNTQRDADPSPSNPLCYRERTYVVPAGTPADVAEAIARERLAALRAALENRPPGKFLNLAVFDHRWSERPERPPLVTIQFKDWQGDPVVDRPLGQVTPSAPAPRRRASTDENDARLADAFEACQDLLFLSTPLEALEFITKLLGDLIPSEAIGACLYDIDDDVYRTVVATGPGSEERRAQALPSARGLLGVASARHVPLQIDTPQADDRFDPEIDGRPGLEVRNLLYLSLQHGGRNLGMLQLLNRAGASSFLASDADLAMYIGAQLSQFLYQARGRAAG